MYMSSDTTPTVSSFEKKLNNGKPNPKYVDVLDEDKPIANQKFVCVSFISPENIIQSKNSFLFSKFLEQYELSKGMEKIQSSFELYIFQV